MVKRSFDVICSVFLLVASSPVLLVLIIQIRHKLGSPVLFRQKRIGLNNQAFEILKFRTMSNAADAEGNLLPDCQRLSRYGTWLRRTSLDELPTLFNVVRGQMSMVGPRPLLVQYLPLYSRRQSRRHEVLPGITGWAQVNGRNAVSWTKKFELDVWYVDNRSLWLDIRILVKTVAIVLRRDGINASGDATMPLFTGHEAKTPDHKADSSRANEEQL